MVFEENAGNEEATELAQEHVPAPPPPTREQLQQWAGKTGAVLAATAASLVAGKNAKAVGDGSSRALLEACFGPNPSILPPVGSTCGATVLLQAGHATTEQNDAPRSGDIVMCRGAALAGRKGLANYHLQLGTASDPLIGVCIEFEDRKHKIRAVVPGKKRAEEVSIRLDDLKSGTIAVARPVPARGYIKGWE